MNLKKVHFMGLSGSGASAVAAIAQSQGFEVSGCDISLNSEYLKPFSKDSIHEGHAPDHLETIDIVAISPAISSLDPNNPELKEAQKRHLEVLTWQEFMGKYLEKDKFVIAVCGTHGKSTTTAMIGKMMEDAGLDPTVELGAIVPEWETNFRIGKSKYFVTEADEFNNNYLVTHADISIVTSIEYDHPEFFVDFEAYKDSFEKFLNQTKQTIIGNISNPGVAEVLKWVRKSSKADCLDYSKSDFGLKLQIPGKHNILNASAAFQVGLLLGIEPQKIKQSLESFSGTSRRFELIGEVNQAKIYSDYAHNPTKVKASIEGAQDKYPEKKIWVVFQPHMFTRTKALFNDFVKVFQNAPIERAFIVDIFASREIDPGDISSRMLVEAIDMGIVEYMPTLEQVWDTIKSELNSKQIIIFIGAGDIDSRIRKIIEE